MPPAGRSTLIHAGTEAHPAGRASCASAAAMRRALQVEFLAPATLVNGLVGAMKRGGTVLWLGSGLEDLPPGGTALLAASRSAFRTWSIVAASELAEAGVRTVYYSVGSLEDCDAVPTDELEDAPASCVGQRTPLALREVAQRVVSSLTRARVAGTHDVEEGHLVVRRDGHRPHHMMIGPAFTGGAPWLMPLWS